MVDSRVFDRRLARLEVLLRDLRGLAEVELDAFLADRSLQAQAERWLHLAAECCLDLAHHLIADRGRTRERGAEGAPNAVQAANCPWLTVTG